MSGQLTPDRFIVSALAARLAACLLWAPGRPRARAGRPSDAGDPREVRPGARSLWRFLTAFMRAGPSLARWLSSCSSPVRPQRPVRARSADGPRGPQRARSRKCPSPATTSPASRMSWCAHRALLCTTAPVTKGRTERRSCNLRASPSALPTTTATRKTSSGPGHPKVRARVRACVQASALALTPHPRRLPRPTDACGDHGCHRCGVRRCSAVCPCRGSLRWARALWALARRRASRSRPCS